MNLSSGSLFSCSRLLFFVCSMWAILTPLMLLVGCVERASVEGFQIPWAEGKNFASARDATVSGYSSLDKFWSDDIEAPHLNQHRFRLLAEAAIQRVNPKIKVLSATDSALVLGLNGQKGEASLDNAWNLCKGEPGYRREMLRGYLAIWTFQPGVTSENSIEASKVVPLVRSPEWLMNSDKGSPLVVEPVCGDLRLAYASEMPRSLSFLPEDSLTNTLRMSRTQVKVLALNNLRSRLPPSLDCQSVAEGVFSVDSGDFFNPSLILLEDFMDVLNKRMGGALYFSVPDNNILLCTDGSSEANLTELRRKTAELYKAAAKPQTLQVFRWRDGRISVAQ